MEKLRVYQVLECNRVLYKMMEQKVLLPISVGLKVKRIMNVFDEVETYVFETMDETFKGFDWGNMTDEEISFYGKLISEEIELYFEKIKEETFENNDKLTLTIDDIDKLSLILC